MVTHIARPSHTTSQVDKLRELAARHGVMVIEFPNQVPEHLMGLCMEQLSRYFHPSHDAVTMQGFFWNKVGVVNSMCTIDTHTRYVCTCNTINTGARHNPTRKPAPHCVHERFGSHISRKRHRKSHSNPCSRIAAHDSGRGGCRVGVGYVWRAHA